MPKSNNWINHGDINPREYGGLFIRYIPSSDKYEIVQTVSIENYETFEYSYFFEYAVVEKSVLIKDKSLHSFAGIDTKENYTEEEIIFIATSWISYYGADNGVDETNNYWSELKKYGIYTSILNR